MDSRFRGDDGMIETEPAYAKINLALHVRERLADGYHRIETLFAFARAGDLVGIEEADGFSLAVSGPFAEGLSAGPDNLVLRAAAALGQGRGARLHLDKHLPVASGIGGGSADGAAALRLLARHWGVEADLGAIARTLGADVPACLASETVRGVGRGDVLARVEAPGLSGMPLLLVNPGVPVPTGPVFAGWDQVDRGPLADSDPLAAALAGRNDLEPSAIALCPVIGELLGWLGERGGVVLARMSGSGATCFALFETEADLARADAETARDLPGFWRLATALR